MQQGQMRKQMTGREGFTLVELLIVVIILAVLAAIVVPQFGSSTEDAKVSTLKADLSALRNAVEVYYQQHDSRYPGKYKSIDGTTASAATGAGECPDSFINQLTLYSDKNGKTSPTKDATYKYGPYVKGGALPANPFLDTSATAVACDVATVSLTTAVGADATASGWKMYAGTGRLVANDGKTLADGTTKTIDF